MLTYYTGGASPSTSKESGELGRSILASALSAFRTNQACENAIEVRKMLDKSSLRPVHQDVDCRYTSVLLVAWRMYTGY